MSGDSEGQGSLVFAVHGVAKSWTQLNNWTTTRVEDRITRKWGKQRLFAHEQSDSPGNSPLPRCHEPSPAAGKGQCPLRDSAWILYRWMKRGLLILRHLHGHLIPRVPLSLLPLHYHIKIFEGRYCVGTLWCRTLDVWWDCSHWKVPVVRARLCAARPYCFLKIRECRSQRRQGEESHWLNIKLADKDIGWNFRPSRKWTNQSIRNVLVNEVGPVMSPAM